jgi:GntR family transcriptional repressor for pyruvate dehydrogenase complex
MMTDMHSANGVPPEPEVRRGSKRIRPQRAAEIVASDIRGRILTGELDGGLPTETILLDEFDVSRPTLREALRILETEGLIQTRRGKQGGAAVRRPTASSAAYHLGLALQAARVNIADLGNARRLLEPLCASLAAQRSDRAAVAAHLDTLTDQAEALVGNGPEFTACALEFHAALVEASANQTLMILVGTIETVWQGQERAWAEEVSAHGTYPDEQGQRHVLQSHRRIARLIAKGDAAGATRTSQNHLSASMSYVCDVGDGNANDAKIVADVASRMVDATPLRV